MACCVALLIASRAEFEDVGAASSLRHYGELYSARGRADYAATMLIAAALLDEGVLCGGVRKGASVPKVTQRDDQRVLLALAASQWGPEGRPWDCSEDLAAAAMQAAEVAAELGLIPGVLPVFTQRSEMGG